jgi:betaine lipid synthase
MASLGGNLLPLDTQAVITFAGVGGAVVLLTGVCYYSLFSTESTKPNDNPGLLRALWLFVYSCFLKPHDGDQKGTQQDALESFYKNQAGAYDATRRALLKGRGDMLALAAAQLEHKAKEEGKVTENKRRIWVDVSHSSPCYPGLD